MRYALVLTVSLPAGSVNALTNVSFFVLYSALISSFVHPLHFFLQLSLFFDILLCLTTDITKEDYIAGTFKQRHAISSGVMSTESQSPGESVMRRARAKLWKNLKEADLKMKAGEKWTEGERKGGGGEREERARKGGREWVREGERE